MKNQDNDSSGMQKGKGTRHAHKTSLKCSGSERHRSSPRFTLSDPAGLSLPSDSNLRAASVHHNLSIEEQRIVALIVAGYTNKDMAGHFSLSQSTIYRRTLRIIAKLGVCNKFELLLFTMSSQLRSGLAD